MSATIAIRKNNSPTLPIVNEALADAQVVIEAHWQKHDREPRYAFVDSTPAELDDCILSNQNFLAGLPSNEVLLSISAECKSYPCASTLDGITKAIATLVGSFPHANMPDPRNYVRMLISDVQSMNYPDVVVAHVCTGMRRILQYPPSIADFLAACEQQVQSWRAYGGYAERLVRARGKWEHVISVQQQKRQAMTEQGP